MLAFVCCSCCFEDAMDTDAPGPAGGGDHVDIRAADANAAAAAEEVSEEGTRTGSARAQVMIDAIDSNTSTNKIAPARI